MYSKSLADNSTFINIKISEEKMTDINNTVTLTAVGDIGFRIEENNETFDGVRPFLKEADINLGQLEALLSGRGARQVHFPGFEWSDMTGPSGWRPNPEAAVKVLVDNGFDIMSFASNHTMDMGDDALFDTLDILKKNNIVSVAILADTLKRIVEGVNNETKIEINCDNFDVARFLSEKRLQIKEQRKIKGGMV